MARYPKKSKYKSVVIKKKRYYFYEILWEDITADGGHATAFEFIATYVFCAAFFINGEFPLFDVQ